MPKTAVGVELQDARLFRQACYVDGAWTEAREVIEVDNPATGEIIGTVPKLGRAETKRAIDAASRAFPAWRRKTARERAAVMRRWFELMLASQDDLARLMTIEQGKPLAESKGEVVYAASFLEWFGEEAKRAYGDTIPHQQPDKRLLVVKEPIGVVACITPWNFPLAMITRKAGPAIASGCTVVLKPASQTPFSALALAELASRAGVPPGVFNVITGSATEIGAELTSNPIVRKLSFTGSTETGKVLMAQCAATVKKLSLELGGNAPFIVFDDADLDAAVEGAMASKYRNTGQTCVCANRLLVQDSVYDRFSAELAEAVKKLAPAPGLDDGATQGPLIDDRAVEKVESHVADAIVERRARPGRRQTAFARRTILRADDSDRRDAGDGGSEGGNVWPGCAAVSILDRGRSDCARQRHGVRARRVLLRSRHRPRLARGRGARIRHRRHQYRDHLDGSGAVWRREGVGHRPRGVEIRAGGVSRDQIPVYGRDLASGWLRAP